MSSWLERYSAGDRVQVWTEMTRLGPDLPKTQDWLDAVEVGRETMRRARVNVERIADFLQVNDYQFAAPDRIFTPPKSDVSAQLDRLEGSVGVLPLALRCWCEEVGQVNLAGRHPDWPYDSLDPLVIDTLVDYWQSEYEQWEADRGTEWDQGTFVLELAPDYLHKDDISGGPPYAMAVPNTSVDGLFLGGHHNTTFTNYLRISFRLAGFPGWDRGELDGWAKNPNRLPPALVDLTESLLRV